MSSVSDVSYVPFIELPSCIYRLIEESPFKETSFIVEEISSVIWEVNHNLSYFM